MEKSEIKMKYEKPVILNLGEMAKGVGACNPNGGYNSTDNCSPGSDATAVPCQSGGANSADRCQAAGSAANGIGPCVDGSSNTGVNCNSTGSSAAAF